jgi:hypothetical protein
MNHLVALAGSIGIAAVMTSVARQLGRSLDPIRQPARLPRVDPTGITVLAEVSAGIGQPDTSAMTHTETAEGRRRLRHSKPRSKATTPSDAVIADWCDTLARRVRGGDSLVSALSHYQPQRNQPRLNRRRHHSSTGLLDEIAASIALATERGQRASEPLAGFRGRSAGLDQALAVIRACLEIGGRAAFVLDRTAAGLRDRNAIAAERATNSAQAQMSALVLTLLPGLAMATMVIGSASMRAALFGPIGWVCVPLGFALNALGWWWMQRLVRA